MANFLGTRLGMGVIAGFQTTGNRFCRPHIHLRLARPFLL